MLLVTKQSLQDMIDAEINDDGQFSEKLQHIVGRALVALFANQTADEKAADVTDRHNGIGFTGADARSGSLTAKSYLKRKALEQWQIERWVRNSGKNGFSRLTKYHKQLNEVANIKAIQKAQKVEEGPTA